MRSDEIRTEALSVYSHANVRDRYDADLMMAGFADGAEWADAHPVASTEPQGEPSDAQAERARIIADLREWARPLGNSPEEETLRLVIERIECGAGGVR